MNLSANPTKEQLRKLLQSCDDRAGHHVLWVARGKTAYRYPKLHGQHPTEDWFNHVLPALMLLRAFARHAAATGRNIRKFSIDAQSSTGFNPNTQIGTPPLPASQITYSQPS